MLSVVLKAAVAMAVAMEAKAVVMAAIAVPVAMETWAADLAVLVEWAVDEVVEEV